MLTPADTAAIAEGFSASDHDHFFNSGIAGEPSLCDGFLSYFDGVTVEVCGFPVTAAHDGRLTERIQDVLDAWASVPEVRYINYCGPVAIDRLRRVGFECQYLEDPVPWNVDVFLDLRRPALQCKEVRKGLRRATSIGIEACVCHREYFGPDHLRLLASLVNRGDYGLEDVGNLNNVATILRHPATFVVEARRGGALTGFAVGHNYFGSIAMSVCGAFDRAVPRSSDAVYGTLVEHCRSLGVTRLGFGYATDEGNYRYKAKWGCAVAGKPFYQRIWGNAPEEDCLHWPWRLYRTSWAFYEAEAAAQ